MSKTPARQPQGQPTGGQFAAKSNPECDVDLEEATPRQRAMMHMLDSQNGELPDEADTPMTVPEMVAERDWFQGQADALTQRIAAEQAQSRRSLSGALNGNPDIRYAKDGEDGDYLAHTTLDVTDPDSKSTQVIRCDGKLAENVALSLYPGVSVVACGEMGSEGQFAATDVGVSMRDMCADVQRAREEPPILSNSELDAAQPWSAELPLGPRTMSGVLQGDPEIRYDRAGTANAVLRVVDPETREWIRVSMTGDMAENVALSTTRGHQVVVRGSVVEFRRVAGVLIPSIEAEDVGASMSVATVVPEPKGRVGR